MELVTRAIDAANAVAGAQTGKPRALHAKGTLVGGTFRGLPAAAKLTRAVHMQGGAHEVVARFSNGSGDTAAHDSARDGRGLAVKVSLPDGATTDIVSVSRPTFFVRTPEDFVELMEARVPDPETGQPDMARLGAFLEAHPESMAAIQAALSAEPAASYAQVAYHAIHAFKWLDAEGGERFVRVRWVPDAGEATMPDDEAAALGERYLQEEIAARIAAGPVRFTLVAQIAAAGDPTDDPTQAWPDDREQVEVATLELTTTDTGRETGDDVLVFDPTRVTDGIELSEDPILRFRSDAYAESVLRRTGVARARA